MNLEIDTLPFAKNTVTTKAVIKIVQLVNQQVLCLLFSYKLQFYLIQGFLAKLPVPGCLSPPVWEHWQLIVLLGTIACGTLP